MTDFDPEQAEHDNVGGCALMILAAIVVFVVLVGVIAWWALR